MKISSRLGVLPHLFSTGLLILISLSSFAQTAIPELWGLRVHDEAKVFSQVTIDQLEQRLQKYEDSTTNQIAVLTILTLGDEVLEDYALRVAEKWGLGTKKNDNGVLLLIVVEDHKMRIEVGNGLEGILTDVQCNRIIRNELAPNFRREDYNAGVLAAVDAIVKAIGGEYVADDPVAGTGMSITERIFTGLFIFGILGLFTSFALFSGGCAGWGLYVFLIPFYAVFPWNIIGYPATGVLFIIYVVGGAIAKIIIPRTAWGKSKMTKWDSKGSSGSASGWSSGSGWGSSSGGSFGGGFSGGGGSFGGGGSSGSW